MRSKPGALLGLACLLAGLLAACPRDAPTSRTVRIHVTPLGAAEKVVLWDLEKGFEREEKPAPSVTFEVPAETLHAAHVTVAAADGSETTSARLEVSAVTTAVEAGTLRVWSARVGFQREGDRLRFSWPKLSCEEAPERLHYSLLFSYRGANGQDLEGTLVSKGSLEAIQTVSELSEIFPDRDPAAKTMTIRIRAYPADEREGRVWAGPKQEWPVPDDLPLQRGAR